MIAIKKNKKAGERYLSIWMILIWFIILVAIVIGVLLFNSIKIDTRAIESNSLSERLISCIQGNFSYEQITSANFSIYKFCNLNRDVADGAMYFFNITLSSSGKMFSISGGNPDYSVQCGYQSLSGKTEPNFAQCTNKQIALTDKKTAQIYNLQIVTASNQKGEFK
jgi:hypothetical protein